MWRLALTIVVMMGLASVPAEVEAERNVSGGPSANANPSEIQLITATRDGKPGQKVSSITKAPDGMTLERDVVYWDGSTNPYHRLDILYAQDTSIRRPALVFIHGGGLRSGWKDRPSYPEAMLYFAKRGYVTLSIDYRLSPAVKAPTHLEDTRTAVRWLRAHADRYGVDPDRIGACGQSAGGDLSALLAFMDGHTELDAGRPYEQYSAKVQAAVPVAGTFDLRPDAFAKTVDADSEHSRQHCLAVLGGMPHEKPDIVNMISAIRYLSPDDPPILIIHGTADKTINIFQAHHLAKALEERGMAHELVLIDGAPHSMAKTALQGKGLAKMEAFFSTHLKPEVVR